MEQAIILGALFMALLVVDVIRGWRQKQRRQQREQMRHILGAERWWGRR